MKVACSGIWDATDPSGNVQKIVGYVENRYNFGYTSMTRIQNKIDDQSNLSFLYERPINYFATLLLCVMKV